MKKIYLITILFLTAIYGGAQSFTVTGPRTFYNLTSTSIAYFNFDKGKVVSSTDDWHIAFNSYNITFNTGVQGLLLSDTSFTKFITAPTSGYSSTIDNGLGTGCFDYNGTTHIVTPLPGKIVAIKLADGRYAKVELLSYYRHAPVNVGDSSYANVTSKRISFRYLVAPASDPTNLSQLVTRIKNLMVPASGSSDYQMINLAIGDTTTSITDKWHLRIKATSVQSNNTTNGPGGYIAQLISTDFNSVTTAPTVSDATLSWYNYESNTHTITPLTGKTLVFKDSLGRSGKLVFENYYQDAPYVVCATAARYYTFSYYYNPYGAGENLNGRSGSDLSPASSFSQSISPSVSLASSSLNIDATGVTEESFGVTANDSWAASTTDAWLSITNGSGTTDGTFNITATANTGAQRTGTITVTYCNGAAQSVAVTQEATTTAIMDATYDQLKVYPNPFTDRLNISFGTTICNELSISNLEGKKIFTIKNPVSSDLEINSAGWEKGIYFMSISSSEGTSYKKLELQ